MRKWIWRHSGEAWQLKNITTTSQTHETIMMCGVSSRITTQMDEQLPLRHIANF